MTVHDPELERRPAAVRWAWLLVLLGGVAAYLIVLRTLLLRALLLRALLAPAGHVAWTGVTTAALWRIPSARRRGRAVALFAAAFATSVALHALWDGSDLWGVRAAVGVISVAGLLVVIHRSRTAGQRLQTSPTWTDLSYGPPPGPEESGSRTPPA